MAKKSKNAQAKTDNAFGESAEMMKNMFGQAGPFSENLSELSRANMEAMAQSLQATSKGFNEMGTKLMGYMQANIQRNLETARTLSAVKSLEDLSLLQDVTKTGFEAYVGQMNELSSLFATTLKEASAPLNSQAGAIVEKFQASA
jgi:hypothetical protein